MQRIDDAPDERYWKIAITGPSGTGKTSLGVSAPKPLIVLSERQGLPSIKMAAKRLGVPVPPVVFVDESEDYRTVVRALRGPKDKPFVLSDPETGEVVLELPVEEWPQTVVIDSLTDACDVLRRELDEQAPDKQGRDGLPVRARAKWNVWAERCMGIVKAFRDLPMHVVFLCLLLDRTREDSDGNVIERIAQPKLATAATGPQLCAAVNVMGYTRRAMRKDGPVYAVQTITEEWKISKPCEPLHQWEVPDLTSWIERLNGNIHVHPDFPVVEDGQEIEPEEDVDEDARDQAEYGAGSGPPVDGGHEGDAPAEGDDTPPMCSECGEWPVTTEGEICGDCEGAHLPQDDGDES